MYIPSNLLINSALCLLASSQLTEILKKEKHREMEMNKNVVLKVAVLLFLLGLTTTVDARFNRGSFTQLITKRGDANNHFVKSTTTACCDNCACTESDPPICTCMDSGDSCHSACELCICLRPFGQ